MYRQLLTIWIIVFQLFFSKPVQCQESDNYVAEFRRNLKDTIVVTQKKFANPNDLFSIGIRRNDTLLFQVITCNDLSEHTKVKINDGCIMSSILFASDKKYDSMMKSKFITLSISRDFEYFYGEGTDWYFKKHLYNHDECVSLVIKILQELYHLENFKQLTIKVDGYKS